MTDTVTRLLALADRYASSPYRENTESDKRHRKTSRQALQDELTRVFTTTHPAPEGFYQGSIADMILEEQLK